MLFDQPLKGTFGFPRAGKIKEFVEVSEEEMHPEVGAVVFKCFARIAAEHTPSGKECSRPFFVRVGGRVHVVDD